MTEQTVSHYEDDEISLLDILVTLAESWKLLVFGPLVVALLAGALSFLWPKTFESTAIVRLTEAEIALISSAPVLDSVIDKFDLLVEFDGNKDDAKDYLTKKITGKFDKKTGLSTIVARAETPERAQEMSKTVIVSLLTELLPKGKNKAQLEKVILSNEGVIANNIDAIEQLKRQMAKTSQSDANLDVMMKHYAALNSEVSRKELENIELEKNLTIKEAEVYVQQPSFPQRRVSPKILVVISLAYLGAIFLLLIYVFTLKALVTIKKNQEAVRKIENIKHYLGFK